MPEKWGRYWLLTVVEGVFAVVEVSGGICVEDDGMGGLMEELWELKHA